MFDKATSWQIQLISTYKKQNKQMTPKSAIHCFYWYFYVNRTKNTNLSNFTHSIKNSQILNNQQQLQFNTSNSYNGQKQTESI